MRIGLIHISQETNDFNPEPTTLRDYEAFGLFEGEDIVAKVGTFGQIGGHFAAIADAGEAIETVPIIRAFAVAGGNRRGRALELAASFGDVRRDHCQPLGSVRRERLVHLTRDRIQRSFSRLRKGLGVAAIFVTHDVVEALLLGDRIGVMRDGRLLQLGAGRDLVHAPADAYVADLLRGPLAQARAVEALLAGDPAGGGAP